MTFDKEAYRINRQKGLRGQGPQEDQVFKREVLDIEKAEQYAKALPDLFTDEAFIAADNSRDRFIVQVGDVRFYLHKNVSAANEEGVS